MKPVLIDTASRIALAIAPPLLAADLVIAGLYDFYLPRPAIILWLCIAAGVATVLLTIFIFRRTQPNASPEQLGFSDRQDARNYSRSLLGIPPFWKAAIFLLFFAFFAQGILAASAIGMLPVFTGFMLAGAGAAAVRRWPIDAT